MPEEIKVTIQLSVKGKEEKEKLIKNLANLGKQTKKSSQGVSKSLMKTSKTFNSLSKAQDKTAKVATRFAQNWSTSFKDAYNHINRLETGTKKVAKGIGYQLTFIAWHFRYLGNIFSKISRQWRRVVKESIDVAAELQESFLSIEVAAAAYGRDTEEATKLAQELALKGLMPLTDAANAVKNLYITGLGFPEARKFIYRFLDVAFLTTSEMDDMTKALTALSERILKGTSIAAGNTTALMLWNETDRRLKKELGLTINQLSKKQKALAILKTIEEKYAYTVGYHEIEEETLRATLNKLRTSIQLLKNVYGEALAPVLGVVANALRKITEIVLDLVPKINTTVALITILGIAITTLIGKISFGIGILISFFNILKGLSAIVGVAAFSFSKLALAALGISAVLTAGTYLVLKYTGVWDKMAKSMDNIKKRIADIKSGFKGLAETQEDGMGIDEDRRVAHERAVEDIMEDLERERSKGLWANQMTIKDLEKRLRRENEDWERYLADREKQGKEEGGIFKNLMDNLENLGEAVDAQTEKMKNAWEKWKDWLKGWQKDLTDPVFWEFFWRELGLTFEKIGKWCWDNFIKYLLDPVFWTALFSEIGKNVWNLGKFILETFHAALMGLTTVLGEALTDALYDPITKFVTWFRDKLNNLISLVNRTIARISRIRGMGWIRTIPELGPLPWEGMGRRELEEASRGVKKGGGTWQKIVSSLLWSQLGFSPFQFGGIVPGIRGQAVPIIAHGGERIIPAGETRGGENVTINMYNTVRNDNDIREIARQVSQVLGQRQRWTKLGG